MAPGFALFSNSYKSLSKDRLSLGPCRTLFNDGCVAFPKLAQRSFVIKYI